MSLPILCFHCGAELEADWTTADGGAGAHVTVKPCQRCKCQKAARP